jgi:hypothetical protein
LLALVVGNLLGGLVALSLEVVNHVKAEPPGFCWIGIYFHAKQPCLKWLETHSTLLVRNFLTVDAEQPCL